MCLCVCILRCCCRSHIYRNNADARIHACMQKHSSCNSPQDVHRRGHYFMSFATAVSTARAQACTHSATKHGRNAPKVTLKASSSALLAHRETRQQAVQHCRPTQKHQSRLFSTAVRTSELPSSIGCKRILAATDPSKRRKNQASPPALPDSRGSSDHNADNDVALSTACGATLCPTRRLARGCRRSLPRAARHQVACTPQILGCALQRRSSLWPRTPRTLRLLRFGVPLEGAT